ncbi:MAG TPA: universal stress protein, partial [Labilithrix sp.]
MSSESVAPRTVVAAVSLDAASLVALLRASFFARQLGGELRVVHVLWEPAEPSAVRLRESARIVLEWARGAGVDLPPECVVIRAGSPDVELARVASTASTGLLVLGGRADGDSGSPGHVARFVARNATAPVVVTSPPAPSRRVVAASDLRDERYPVLRAAAAFAVALGARATAVHNVEAAAGESTASSERLLEGVARSACFDEALVTREPTAP